MKKIYYLLIGILLLAVSVGWLCYRGGEATVVVNVDQGVAEEDMDISLSDPGIVRIEDLKVEDGKVTALVAAEGRGRVFLDVKCDDSTYMGVIYVHAGGIITTGSYMGECRGGRILPLMGALYAAILLFGVLRKLRRDLKGDIYRYRTITDLGLIIFLSFLLVIMALMFLGPASVIGVVKRFLYSAQLFATLALPVVFVFSFLISLSNIYLMRREGRTWRNMLGTILGFFVMILTLMPIFLGEYLQRTTIIDVHNERGVWLYIEQFVENGFFIAVVYLECILLASVIILGRAAKKTPDFDRDYILILGCKVRADKTPTPLLRGRADKALEFAKRQEEATGKQVVFVPSGGQGSDEPISEGACVTNYLREQGIPEERILPEEKSTSTQENFRFSMERIREHWGDREGEPKIAFATTNYHVFRSGLLAEEQGVVAQGTGSRTKSYFHFNAFVREFIATLVQEKKVHVKVVLSLVILMIVPILILYLDTILS